MSLLQVQKKAETDGEVQALIQETLSLQSPFGVPTVFLTEADFYNVNFSSPDVFRKLGKQIRKKMAGGCEDFQYGYETMRDSYGADYAFNTKIILTYNAFQSLKPNPEGYAWCKFIPGRENMHGRMAHDFSAEYFQSPLFSVAFMPVKNQSECPVPELHAQSTFHTLWHEIAHTMHVDEPHADMIGSIMCRKHIKASPSLIAYNADRRAYNSFGGVWLKEYRQDVNWHVVNAMDYVETLPQDTIEQMDMEQFLALRFLKFPQTYKPFMKSCTAIFKQTAGCTWENDIRENCTFLADVSEHFLKKWADRKGTPEYSILQRFNLATTRLSIGVDAYKDDRLEQKIWENGYRLHFMPEALPEFLPPP